MKEVQNREWYWFRMFSVLLYSKEYKPLINKVLNAEGKTPPTHEACDPERKVLYKSNTVLKSYQNIFSNNYSHYFRHHRIFSVNGRGVF